MHTRNRVEDNPILLLLVITRSMGEKDSAEMNQPAIARPVDRGVVYDVAGIGDLYLA